MPNGQFSEEQDAMVTQGTPVAPAALGGIIPAGAPGGGTATIGTQEIPFPRQVWEQSDWNAWRQRQDEYDRKKQEAEENRQFMELLGQNTRTNQAAKAVESARQFIEMRGFDRDLRAAKAAGLSDEQAFLQSAFRHPGMFGGGVGTGMGSLLRSSRPEPEAFIPGVVDIPGAGQMIRSGRYGERLERVEAPGSLRKTITPNQKYGITLGPPTETISGPAAQVDEYYRTNRPAVSAPKSYPPVPASKSQRVKGTIYQSPKGPAEWTGTGWIKRE